MIDASPFSPVPPEPLGRGPCRWPILISVIALTSWADSLQADVSLTSSTRQHVALDGPWQLLQSDSDNLMQVPEDGEWAPVAVPHVHWKGWLNTPAWPKSAWYRRSFPGPRLNGRRAVLHFTRVGFQCRVYLNGEEIGNHIGSQVPFQFDVTDALKQGAPNELTVGLMQSTRARRGEYGNMPKTWSEDRPEWVQIVPARKRGFRAGMLRELEDGSVSWPSGYGYWFGGINQSVGLVLLPPVYVDDIFIIPSVRKKHVTVHAEIISHLPDTNAAIVSADILDGERVVRRLKPVEATLKPGDRTLVELSDAWPDPVLWDPDHPHLYRCRVTVSAAGTEDAASDRFGFREIWREGSRLYLNGVGLLLRSDTHYAGTWSAATADDTRKFIRDKKYRLHANAITFKCQTPAMPEYWDICDEEGMLLIQQFDIGTEGGQPSLWDCAEACVVEYLRSIRNHPSLVVQQLGNENTYGMGGGVPNSSAPWIPNMVKVFEAAMAADPTRLRTPGGGDMDPGGVSDFYDFHGGPTSGWHDLTPNVHIISPQLAWGRRDKALMFSEWNEWVQGSMCSVIGDEFFRADPGAYGLRYPNGAYRLYGLAQAESYEIGAAEFRKQRVSAFNCFGTVDRVRNQESDPQAQQRNLEVATRNLRPVVAVPLSYAHNHRAGMSITRRLFVSNDSFSQLDGALLWKLSDTRSDLQAGRLPLSLEPGHYEERELIIDPVAASGEPVRLTLAWRIVEKDSVLYENEQPLTVFAKPDWEKLRSVRIDDPEGKTIAALNAAGVELTAVDSIEQPDGSPVVLGADASWSAERWRELERFVGAGGRVLIQRPAQWPESWCGVNLVDAYEGNWYGLPSKPEEEQPHFRGVYTGFGSTYAWRRAPEHPILRGLADDDLRWWRGQRHFDMPLPRHPHSMRQWPKQNMVSLGNWVKPTQGRFRCLVDAGNQRGMNMALLLEIPFGRGTALMSALLMAEKAADDPAAETLLYRCLEYLAACAPRNERSIVALAPCPGLESRGIALAGPDTPLAVEKVAVATVQARWADWDQFAARRDELLSFVHAGGTLYVHDLTPEGASKLSKLIGAPIETRPVANQEPWWLDSTKIAFPDGGHPVTAGLGCFDLNLTVDFNSLIYQRIQLPDPLLQYSVHSDAPGSEELTVSPLPGTCALLRVPMGNGQVIIDQVMWDATPEDTEYVLQADVGHFPIVGLREDITVSSEMNRHKTNRYIATLLTNLLYPVTP